MKERAIKFPKLPDIVAEPVKKTVEVTKTEDGIWLEVGDRHMYIYKEEIMTVLSVLMQFEKDEYYADMHQ